MSLTPPPSPSPNRSQTSAIFNAAVSAFVAWMTTFVTEFNLALGTISAAIAAALAAVLSATSATSLTVGTGAQSLTVAAGLSFGPGQWVLIARSSAPSSTWMFGQVVTYSDTNLVVGVTSVLGAGTFTDWTVSLSGPRGADGNVTVGKTIALALIFGD